jgi:hypothetical protein
MSLADFSSDATGFVKATGSGGAYWHASATEMFPL